MADSDKAMSKQEMEALEKIKNFSGLDKTFAEMTQEEKASVSHRGKAIKQLIQFLNKQ